MNFRTYILLSALTLAAPVAEAALIRGPYLQVATSNSIVVRWRTDVQTDSRVRFGLSANELIREASSTGPVRDHLIALTNLTADTTYYYSVESGTTVLAGGLECRFTTYPLQSRATRIWALGDCGTASLGSTAPLAVRDGYINFGAGRQTDVWLMLGDNAYFSGTDLEYQAAVFDVYQDFLRTTAIWPTIGNHETYAADPGGHIDYFDIFTLPQDGSAGGVPSGSEKYYSFTHGNVHFVCLDSELSPTATSSAMVTWLEQDLAASTSEWLIAYWHSPPYSKGGHDSDLESNLVKMRESVVPVLERYGVDLVLSGHSHSYERSFLLDGHYGVSTSLTPSMIQDGRSGRADDQGAYLKEGTDSGRGAVYVVSGSAGQVSSGPFNHPAMYISLAQLGSVVIDVESNRLEAKFVRETGVVEDHFSIFKGPVSPVIVSGPQNQTAYAGDAVTLTVQATGTAPLRYQWQFNGEPISGATNALLSLASVQLSEQGLYVVVVTNSYGRATTSDATLTVLPPRPDPIWDLARDFSVSQNPNGVWSYGYKTAVDGVFGLNTVAQAGGSDNGVPLAVWSYQYSGLPQVFFNPTTNTAATGTGSLPPRGVEFFAGFDGTPQNFGAIRLTVPPGASESYVLETWVRTYLEPPTAGDTDFHVVHNGLEVYSKFLDGGSRTGYTNALLLATGDVVDFLVGRGMDRSVYASGLILAARVYPNIGTNVVVRDVSRDFSRTSNPNGVWSYGWVPNLSGSFTLLTTPTTTTSPESAVFDSWQLDNSSPPAVHFNSSSTTGSSDGGQGIYPPGTLWIIPGLDGRPEAFSGARFTVPDDEAGTYRIETRVRTHLEGSLSGDSDFHVLHNGQQLFEKFIAASSGSAHTNTVRLATGDTVDFLVGRGTDGLFSGSGLKLDAALSLIALNRKPAIPDQSFALNENTTKSFTLAAFDLDTDPLTYQITPPEVGTLAGAAPNLRYTPPPNFRGRVTFTVRVSDGLASSPPATVTLTVLAVDCTAHPVSWWPLEQDGRDTAGFNVGVLIGDPAFAAGKVGKGMIFDGLTDSMRVTRSATLHIGAGAGFTAELWAKPDNASAIQPLLEWNSSGAVGVYLWLSATGDGTLNGNIFADTGPEHSLHSAPGTVTSGEWQHFALTYNRADGKGTLYRNGAVVLQRTFESFTPQTSWDLFVGSRLSYRFKGMMDEVSLYNRALSAAEIQTIYTSGSSGKCGNAPTIIAQPVDTVAVEHEIATLSVVVEGSSPLDYQWRFNGNPIPGAKSPSLILANVQFSQAGQYSVAVSNALGYVVSSNATLTVRTAPPPPTWDVIRDFSASTNPSGVWSYGYKTALDGEFGLNLVQETAPQGNGVPMSVWSYQAQALPQLFFNGTTQNAVTGGHVYPPGTLIYYAGFDAQPQTFGSIRLTVPDGADGEYLLESSVRTYLDAPAAGDTDYHVVKNGQELFGEFIPGGGRSGYTNRLALSTGDTVDFLVGRGKDGTVYGSGLIIQARLYFQTAISNPPSIINQPVGIAATVGDAGTLSVRASGTPPLSYQWLKGAQAIAGATSASLVFQALVLDDNGDYRVVVSNPHGAVTSAVAVVRVAPPPTLVTVPSFAVTSGASVQVPINVHANGSENALGFSFEFDPSVWDYSNAELPPGLSQASLLANTTEVTSGRLGLAIGLASGVSLTAQTQALVVITLDARPLTSPIVTTLGFGDRPTVRQVASPLATPLPARYVSGTATVDRATFEADIAPRPAGDASLGIVDWVQAGRFVAGLDTAAVGEFQRADCAPRSTKGNGVLTVADWVQAGRYAAGLDPLTALGGPSAPTGPGGQGQGGGGPVAERSLVLPNVIASAGGLLEVSVRLESGRNENALGFSVAFDSSRLRFLSASLPSSIPLASLNVNSNLAIAGQLGFALALPSGKTLVEDTGDVLKITFAAQPNVSGTADLRLIDSPVVREVADVYALSLPCEYSPGSIAFDNSARLSARRSGASLVLSWPAAATDFELYSSESIQGSTWDRVQSTPVDVGGQKVVVLSFEQNQKWFRLMRP